jgi:ring-1,2-phenylacetyl-CoA epoxidase subunit PaaC
MNLDLTRALTTKLLALADDEFILGHRNSEWCGHAPILEEDIAFANIAQDEIGHAILWYEAIQNLTGQEPNQLAFFRGPFEWRNTQLVELPKGDWAFTMLRQYLFDTYELGLLELLSRSTHTPLADIAAKAYPEERYHYHHTSNWVTRLGLGTQESNQRMQAALNILWPYALQLFVPLPDETLLVQDGLTPDSAQLRAGWLELVSKHLTACDLAIPNTDQPTVTDRAAHTEHLTTLLTDMQEVAHTEIPETEW